MRDIYASIYEVLAPGGIMVLVVKNFVRKKALVPLSKFTVQLCEAAGFRFVRCPEGHYNPDNPHTHLCPIPNPSFWINIQRQKWIQANPGQEENQPYSAEEIVLVFEKP